MQCLLLNSQQKTLHLSAFLNDLRRWGLLKMTQHLSPIRGRRPDTRHQVQLQKRRAEWSCHVLRPAGHGFAKAAQRSVRLFCHKGALQTCAPFVHHSIGVARALSCTAALWGVAPDCRMAGVQHLASFRPFLQLAVIPLDGSLAFSRLPRKAGTARGCPHMLRVLSILSQRLLKSALCLIDARAVHLCSLSLSTHSVTSSPVALGCQAQKIHIG